MPSFAEQDVVEQHLAKPVEQMTPQQLVNYVRGQNALLDIDLPPRGHPERAVFKSLQEQYGKELAGRLVKWAYWRYGGYFRGTPVGYFDFTVSRRWFCDKLAAEVQDHLKVEAKKKKPAKSQGFATMDDL